MRSWKRQALDRTLAATVFMIAAVGGSPTSAENTGIEVVVHTVGPDPARGHLTAFSLDDGLLLEVGGEKRHIAARDIVSIYVDDSMANQLPAGGSKAGGQSDEMTLTLTGGDILHGRPVEGRSEAVVIETVDLGRVLIPLETIRHLSGAGAKTPGHRDSAAWLRSTGRGDDDQILLTNGDVLQGFISGLDSDGVVIDTHAGEMKVPHRLVIAARIAGTSPKPIAGLHLMMTLRESGRLTVTSLDWLDASAEVRLRDGTRMNVPQGRIARIEVVGGRWERLSGHSPISYEHVPMLALDWEFRRDRNVLGGTMVVAGESFGHGVGVHSRSSLSYELKGLYSEFVTSMGLDDSSGLLADVTTLILVDGQRRFEREHIRRGTLVGPIRLDVSRANRIELIVDFGDNGDVQDRFNWVDAGLVRGE